MMSLSNNKGVVMMISIPISGSVMLIRTMGKVGAEYRSWAYKCKAKSDHDENTATGYKFHKFSMDEFAIKRKDNQLAL